MAVQSKDPPLSVDISTSTDYLIPMAHQGTQTGVDVRYTNLHKKYKNCQGMVIKL